LKNPLSDSKDTLYIIAMGDSVVWGNGLYPNDTFMYKFGHDVADRTGRNVQVVFYAHSGARFDLIDDYTSTLYFDAQGKYIGDISSERPTTEEQAECAAQQYPQAEILVMDGCINEVGATEIALPFPLNFTNPDEIVESTSGCGTRWPEFLKENVLTKFDKATVVVLNYYEVVSQASKPLVEQAGARAEQANADAGLSQAVGTLDDQRLTLLKKSGLTTKKAKTRIAPVAEPNALQLHAETSDQKVIDWSANSRAFLVTSQNCEVAAVNIANGLQNSTPCPKAAHYDPNIEPIVPPVPMQATQGSRTILAAPAPYPWPANYSYGAIDTHLWYLPIPKSREYEDYGDQEKRCKAEFNLLSEKDYLTCIWDPMGHPNVPGAESYRQGLVDALGNAWKTD
jgi:hypothetical protein